MRDLALIFTCALLLIGCDSQTTTSTPSRSESSSQLLMGEGSIASNGLAVTNGNVVLKAGRPGIAFAFVTIPGQAKKFGYFLVFNHNFPEGGVATQSGGDILTAKTSHTIKSFGNECKAEFRMELNANTNTVKADKIVVADSSYNTAEGKLILIDMKTMPPTVTQLNLELPAGIPNLEKPAATEKFGEDILSQLRRTEKKVDAFCLQIEQAGR